MYCNMAAYHTYVYLPPPPSPPPPPPRVASTYDIIEELEQTAEVCARVAEEAEELASDRLLLDEVLVGQRCKHTSNRRHRQAIDTCQSIMHRAIDMFCT